GLARRRRADRARDGAAGRWPRQCRGERAAGRGARRAGRRGPCRSRRGAPPPDPGAGGAGGRPPPRRRGRGGAEEGGGRGLRGGWFSGGGTGMRWAAGPARADHRRPLPPDEPQAESTESPKPDETNSSFDIDLKVGLNGFRLGGRLFGSNGFAGGAWLNGETR